MEPSFKRVDGGPSGLYVRMVQHDAGIQLGQYNSLQTIIKLLLQARADLVNWRVQLFKYLETVTDELKKIHAELGESSYMPPSLGMSVHSKLDVLLLKPLLGGGAVHVQPDAPLSSTPTADL